MKHNNRNIPTPLGVVAALLLVAFAEAGCRRVEVVKPTQVSWLGFDTPVSSPEYSPRAGAGSVLAVQEELKNMPMAVYGMYETGEAIFLNQPEKVYYVDSYTDALGDTYTDQWVYGDPSKYNCGTDEEPRRPWNRLLSHQFRAFHPYDATGNNVENGLPDGNIQSMSDAQRLVLDYYTQTNKFDLMVARTIRHPLADGVGKVTMNFQHVLSALQFKVKYAAEIEDLLVGAHLNGVSASGVLYYGVMLAGDSDTNIRWTPAPISDNNYIWEGSVAFNNNTEAVAFDGDGVIFAIPQTIEEDQVTFVFKTGVGDTAIHRAKLPAITWQPGKKYIYTMTLKGAELDVAVTIKEWNEVKSNVDIYI